MSNTDILNKLTTGESNWRKISETRRVNREWLKRSSQIAIAILKRLKETGMSQKKLAEEMGVSPQYINKIVKGHENLTLDTISKIESILNCELIEVVPIA